MMKSCYYRIIEEEMGNYRYSITIFDKALMIHNDLDSYNDQYFSNTIEWIVCLREKVFFGKSELKVMRRNSSDRST